MGPGILMYMICNIFDGDKSRTHDVHPLPTLHWGGNTLQLVHLFHTMTPVRVGQEQEF